MGTTQLLLNEQMVTITADPTTVKKLNEDDHFLADYINKAAKSGQFHFLFTKDPSLRRIVVKRLPNHIIPVWTKKGRPSDTDNAATILLLRLRNSEKYVKRFREGVSCTRLWEELAEEMRTAGYDVDAQKCAQKFSSLMQKVDPIDVQSDDEEWLPGMTTVGRSSSGMKRKRRDEEVEVWGKGWGELKEERWREVVAVMKRRNELMEEKMKVEKEVVGLLGKLLRKL